MRTKFWGMVLSMLGGVSVFAGACIPTYESTESTGAPLNDGDPCTFNTDCDDNNDCTRDTCTAAGCAHSFYMTAGACSQQPLGYCRGPICMSGLGSECSDVLPCSPSNNECTHRSCDNGHCVEYANQDGTACTNVNGAASQCYQGACEACVSNTDCDDGNECTIDVCNSVGACVNTSNDLAPCNGSDFCWKGACCDGCIDNSGEGVCVSQCPSGTHCNNNLTCVN